MAVVNLTVEKRYVPSWSVAVGEAVAKQNQYDSYMGKWQKHK
jgi:hypothetical protein